MAIGPVPLIVLAFTHPDFHGEVIAELERLRESDAIRVIDALAVYKDAKGEVEVEHLSNLSTEEAIELGSKVGALVGLGIEGEAGMEAGAMLGAAVAAEQGVHVLDDEQAAGGLGRPPRGRPRAAPLDRPPRGRAAARRDRAGRRVPPRGRLREPVRP